MTTITRDTYLSKLMRYKDAHLIKVITGIRRCGKSTLMKSFSQALEQSADVPADRIIYLSFDDFATREELPTYRELYRHVDSLITGQGPYYVFIDEVQVCEDFQKAVVSLYEHRPVDLYLSGSNAFLLGGDLATLLTGRYVELKVFPFSFAEYVAYQTAADMPETDMQSLFDAYARTGGLAGAYPLAGMAERYEYLISVFDTIVSRDIIPRYAIQNETLFRRVVNYLVSNIGSLSSIKKISDTLSSGGLKANNGTVSSYVASLVACYLFMECRRYDVKGKQYLTTLPKFYLTDHGFRYALLGTKNPDFGHIHENIVAVELQRRGHGLFVGKLTGNEVDFIATSRDSQVYIQVCDDISHPETLDREVRPLLSIRDAYPKVIIARTRHEEYSIEGIRILDLASWLLAPAGTDSLLA